MQSQLIQLDPEIRDCHYISLLLASTPTQTLLGIREQSRTLYSQAHDSFITYQGFASRQSYLVQAFTGKRYHQDPLSEGAPNPMNPRAMEGMLNGMKGQMSQMISQTLVMSWISHFFSGFVVCRLPFALTVQFKSMLQRDIMTRDLDATCKPASDLCLTQGVSALSWYFLNLFGLRSVFGFILGDDNSADGVRDMSMMSAPQQAQDMNKAFTAEIKNLKVARILDRYNGAATKEQQETRKDQ